MCSQIGFWDYFLIIASFKTNKLHHKIYLKGTGREPSYIIQIKNISSPYFQCECIIS